MSLISLSIHVDRLNDVLALFDRIEVHRSIVGSGGPFVEITDPLGPTAAVVDGTEEGPFTLSGETLDFSVDGTNYSVTFVGTDPLSITEVITQINAVLTNIASEVPTDTDLLRLTSSTTGTGSTVEVSSSTAATTLGLSTTKVSGKGSRVTLVSGTTDYQFIDLDGDESYFYVTRYSSTISSTVSSFSDPRQGSAAVVAPAGQLSTATFQLINGAGQPLVGQCVRFFPQTPHLVTGTVQNLLPGHQTNVFTVTNEAGEGQIDLIRGAAYRAVFEGTNYQREFVVPDEATFDLMTVLGTSPDPFDIAQAPPRPIKVS